MMGGVLDSNQKERRALLINAVERSQKMKTLKSTLGMMVVCLILLTVGNAMAM
jgi:hypothetical protein